MQVKLWKYGPVKKKDAPGKGARASDWEFDGNVSVLIGIPHAKKEERAKAKRGVEEEAAEGQAAGAGPSKKPKMTADDIHAMFRDVLNKSGLEKSPENEEKIKEAVQKLIEKQQEGAAHNRQWADFVFEPEYSQMAMETVMAFVEKNKHLPWMRSAKEVSETGIDINTDLPNLLETVENLYLHMADIQDLCKRIMTNTKPDARAAEAFGRSPDNVAEMMEVCVPQFLQRVMSYAHYLPVLKTKQEWSAEDRAITIVSRELYDQLREDNPGAFKKIKEIVRKWGVPKARDSAKLAIRRVEMGVSDRSCGGEFINMSKNEDDDFLHRFEDVCKGYAYQDWKPRSYQEEWAARVTQQTKSSLLVAPTGCGKTRVAAMVLNQMWQEKSASKCIFLSETVPLCIQQMGAMKVACKPFPLHPLQNPPRGRGPREGPRVMGFGSFHNRGKTESWEELLSKYDMLFFTPAYLLNTLDKLKVPPGSLPLIDLVIVDEVHHVGKKHPFRQVLDDYVPRTTRILGLTASVGGSDRGVEESQDRITDLLGMLKDAEIISENDLSTTARRDLEKGKPDVKTRDVHVPPSALESWFTDRADDVSKRLQEMRQGKPEDSTSHKLLTSLVVALQETLKIASDCGVSEALSYLADEYLAAMLLPETRNDETADSVQNVFVLSGLYNDLRHEVAEPDPMLIDDEGFATPQPCNKLTMVLKQLNELLDKHGEQQTFKCILFMKTRNGVKCALEYLEGTWGKGDNDMRKRVYEDTLPRKLVGRSSRVVSETLKSQTETVELFRDTGPTSCKLLITTSVAEEGLDFPECNAVLSADGISSDIGFVQRKGRARDDGDFIVMVSGRKQQGEYDRAKRKLANAEQAMRDVSSGKGSAEVIVYKPTPMKSMGVSDHVSSHDASMASRYNPPEQSIESASPPPPASPQATTAAAVTSLSTIESHKEEWRIRIAKHLEVVGSPVPVQELGSQVRRPDGIGSNQKVIEILRGDPQNRFDISGEGTPLLRVGLRNGEYMPDSSPPRSHSPSVSSVSSSLPDITASPSSRPSAAYSQANFSDDSSRGVRVKIRRTGSLTKAICVRDYQDLLHQCIGIVNSSIGKISLCYQDDDGEDIAIESDEDFVIAVEHTRGKLAVEVALD